LKISLAQTIDKQYLKTILSSKTKVYEKLPVKNLPVSQTLAFAEEVRKDGQRLPLVCIETTHGPEVILGELYLRVLKLASLDQVLYVNIEEVPVEILHLIILTYLEENLMSIAEQVIMLHYLSSVKKYSHSQLALRFKTSRTVVTNRIRLARLPFEVMNGLVNNDISEGHARSLLALKRDDLIVNAFEIMRRDNLSVREAEELVRRLLGRGKRIRTAPVKLNAEYEEMANKLGEFFETRVYVQPLLRGGRLVISFKSKDDLKKLLEKVNIVD